MEGGSVKQHSGVRFLLSGCAAVTVANRFECGQRQPTGHQSHFHTYTAALDVSGYYPNGGACENFNV